MLRKNRPSKFSKIVVASKNKNQNTLNEIRVTIETETFEEIFSPEYISTTKAKPAPPLFPN